MWCRKTRRGRTAGRRRWCYQTGLPVPGGCRWSRCRSSTPRTASAPARPARRGTAPRAARRRRSPRARFGPARMSVIRSRVWCRFSTPRRASAPARPARRGTAPRAARRRQTPHARFGPARMGSSILMTRVVNVTEQRCAQLAGHTARIASDPLLHQIIFSRASELTRPHPCPFPTRSSP